MFAIDLVWTFLWVMWKLNLCFQLSLNICVSCKNWMIAISQVWTFLLVIWKLNGFVRSSLIILVSDVKPKYLISIWSEHSCESCVAIESVGTWLWVMWKIKACHRSSLNIRLYCVLDVVASKSDTWVNIDLPAYLYIIWNRLRRMLSNPLKEP